MNTSIAGQSTDPGQRFTTLDVFRGMTIFLMIVVNTPGGGSLPYSPLLHAEWNGCTLTDLVFPSFLFAVGHALAFAIRKWEYHPKGLVLYRIFRRTLLLLLAGYLLSWYTTMRGVPGHIAFASFGETRILAVLQRIALCYCLAALMARFLTLAGVWITALIFLLGYWGILVFFGQAGQPYSETGNVVRHVDLSLIGERHMYREHGLLFDPEGLLSTIPATVNVIAGYLTGLFMRQKGKTYECLAKLLLVGVLLLLTGTCWNGVMPVNKKLWTSSFVVYSTGIDLMALGVLYYAIEIQCWKRGIYFFSVLGKNPLFIYVLSNLFLIFLVWDMGGGTIFIDWINAIFFQKIAPGPFGSLLFAVSFTMLCWMAGWVMDRRKIYIRI